MAARSGLKDGVEIRETRHQLGVRVGVAKGKVERVGGRRVEPVAKVQHEVVTRLVRVRVRVRVGARGASRCAPAQAEA